jgi:hypothetical protein
MRCARLQSSALVQIHPHPYDYLRIEPLTGRTMFTKTFTLLAVVLTSSSSLDRFKKP